MKLALQVFAEYAAAFEQTFKDDDWARLTPFFTENATYEVRGGPMACKIAGRENIFAGLKKSLDGFDRRFSERRLELTQGPDVVDTAAGHEISIGWKVVYQYQDAPKLTLPGRSAFEIAGGAIVAMRDDYDDDELTDAGAWMEAYGQELDGSYV